MSDYEKYTVADFIEDERFIAYVRNGQFAELWDVWRAENPTRVQIFDDAYVQLAVIFSADRGVDKKNLDGLYDEIRHSIKVEESRGRMRRLRYAALTGLAASLFVGVGIFWFFTSEISVRSAYGKQQHVVLPDGSSVELNANSEIRYKRAFNWLSLRSVDLRGEALFDVKHLNVNPADVKSGERFVVHSEKLEVSVLGTRFNFKARPAISRVSLISGSIRVRSNGNGKSMMLLPGQEVELLTNGHMQINEAGISSATTAWTLGKLIVTRTRVSDVVSEYQSLYGKTIVLPEKAYGDRILDGAMSIQSEDGILFVLKNILDVNVRRSGDTIYLDKR